MFITSNYVSADREPHVPADVYSGWRWPECFQQRECRSGTLWLNVQCCWSFVLQALSIQSGELMLVLLATLMLLFIDCLVIYLKLYWFCDNSNLQIEETLRSVGKSQLFTRLSYPGAGHLIEPPYSPNSRASLWSVKPKKCERHPRTAFLNLPRYKWCIII